jgi:hypothetical protein
MSSIDVATWTCLIPQPATARTLFLTPTSTFSLLAIAAIALSWLSLRSHFSTATTTFRLFAKLSFRRPALALAL